MGTFANQRKQAFATARHPERVESTPISAFAEEWPARKSFGETVLIGIRRIPDGAISKCRGEASKIASLYVDPESGDRDGWIEAYNDALMRQTIAHATCRASDVTMPFFDMAEDTVKVALTSEGVRFLFDAILAHSVATSPLQGVLEREESSRLVELLQDDALAKLGPRGVAASRLLRRALEDVELLLPDAVGLVDDENVVTIKAKPKT